jgi:hypothetical protein
MSGNDLSLTAQPSSQDMACQPHQASSLNLAPLGQPGGAFLSSLRLERFGGSNCIVARCVHAKGFWLSDSIA